MSEQSSRSFPEVLLVLEAATAAGSVALIRHGIAVAEAQATMGASREDSLMPAVHEVLSASGIAMRDVCAIVCGAGPGSFTSLRIAAAMSKGFAQAGNVPLYGIPSLTLAALELRAQSGEYLLHSDALRGERFVQQFRVANGTVESIGELQRMSLARLDENAETGATAAALVAIGNKHVSAHDTHCVVPRAQNVAWLANRWEHYAPVDLSTWEPNYGRLAEAQVKWEEANQRALPIG